MPQQHARDWSLTWVLIAAALSWLALTAGLGCAFRGLGEEELRVGLTNVATVGGIVSGLSLSGTAVLSLNGALVGRILRQYHRQIRFVLLGGFLLLVLASLACALAAMWASHEWSRWVLAGASSLMCLTLIATALLINSAFSWQLTDASSESSSPYVDI